MNKYKEEREKAEWQAARDQDRKYRESRAITNDQVVQMARAGTSDMLICNEIRTHGGRFDTSPSAIINLQQSGVSDTVIQAMQNCRGY